MLPVAPKSPRQPLVQRRQVWPSCFSCISHNHLEDRELPTSGTGNASIVLGPACAVSLPLNIRHHRCADGRNTGRLTRYRPIIKKPEPLSTLRTTVRGPTDSDNSGRELHSVQGKPVDSVWCSPGTDWQESCSISHILGRPRRVRYSSMMAHRDPSGIRSPARSLGT